MSYANVGHYEIVFSKSAENFLNTLDRQTKLRIFEKIEQLRKNDENLDIKKLKSSSENSKS